MEPYKDQQDAVLAAVKHGRGTISMPTGTGKSVTMALLVNALQVRTLIIVPTLALKNQLRESFTAFFGSLNNITIENIDSGKLNTASDYDCLIIDEAHHVAASTYRKLNKRAWGKIYYRFFFTATPFRSKSNEQMLLESVAGQVIYELTYHQSVDAGYIVPVEAYYVDVPPSVTHANTWAGVYSTLVVQNEARNKIIAQLLATLNTCETPTLCLVKEIKHGENLQALKGIHFANGLNQDTQLYIQAFNRQKINCLIGTTGILGEGVDTKPAEFIILAALGKSKNAFMQQVGRGLRRFKDKASCKVILFKDFSHKWTLAHFKAQVKILKDEYGVIPVKLDL